MSWDKKKTTDAYLARIPPGLRQQMERDAREGRAVPNQFNEATVTGSIMAMPRPMYMGSVQGTEDGGLPVKTSKGTNNSHVHVAYIDGDGNGHTTMDDGHAHTVRSGMVDHYQDPFGMMSHRHPGKVVAVDAHTHIPTPPYDGNPHQK